MSIKMKLSDIIEECGVKFGTSGARGLVTGLTDYVCYAYSLAFLQHLKSIGESFNKVAIAGDLRPSTERILKAVSVAVKDSDCELIYCGYTPSPALALYGIGRSIPTIMITGSHIPDDRNGIKYNKCSGEIAKSDEAGIKSQNLDIPDYFKPDGSFKTAPSLPVLDTSAETEYIKRYTEVFPENYLAGKTVGIYQHSAVGRELVSTLMRSLGAKTIELGFSDTFIPVDTEAIRPEDVELAANWAKEHKLDIIVSTDGDSDRPLISNEKGKWFRGDILGVLTAKFLNAEAVATPVSCNTAVEKCGYFKSIKRTRIGSPYVIAGMEEAVAEGSDSVVGYEANGGFLTATSFELFGNTLGPLATRDAILPMLALLSLSIESGKALSEIESELPSRFTASDRIQEFPTELSQAKLAQFENIEAIEEAFSLILSGVKSVDRTDGIRIEYENSEIIHLRPSGNAPELRCYTEADSNKRAIELNQTVINLMSTWK